MNNANTIRRKLTEAKIPFTERDELNGFWGTRFLFDRKEAKKVQKALGTTVIMDYYEKSTIIVYG